MPASCSPPAASRTPPSGSPISGCWRIGAAPRRSSPPMPSSTASATMSRRCAGAGRSDKKRDLLIPKGVPLAEAESIAKRYPGRAWHARARLHRRLRQARSAEAASGRRHRPGDGGAGGGRHRGRHPRVAGRADLTGAISTSPRPWSPTSPRACATSKACAPSPARRSSIR